MDNEEDLLDDKHFNDGNYEFEDLDADAENKLLGLSDEEGNNFEYEYVDEDGKPVVLDENNQTEYEVVQEEEKNQNAEDVLDLEVDPDLEFDESAVSESSHTEQQQPTTTTIKKEIVNEEHHNKYEHEECNTGQMSDSSESDDENAGRGRFRSERPNIVQLSSRSKRNNIPDSLDDVLRDDMSGGNYRNPRGQFKQRGNAYNQRQYEQRDRFNQREYSNNKDRSPSKHPQQQQQQSNAHNYSSPGNSNNEQGMANNTWNQPEQNFQANVASNENQATGPRKILINPHFKGSLPVNEAPPPNLWNADQNQMNYNEAYRQNIPQQQQQQQQLLSGPSFNNQLGYGGQEQGQQQQQLSNNAQGLLPIPNQLSMVSQMRLQPPINSNEALKSNDFQWNRINNNNNNNNTNFQTLPPPHQLLSPSNLLQPTSTGLMEQAGMPPLLFPPPIRERPPPLLQNNQFFDNRQFQMRPMHSPNNPQQWHSNSSNSNFDQFGNHQDGNMWRAGQQQHPSNNQQQQQPSLLSSPSSLMGKFPDVRQPPPNLQMQQQGPRPVMNFNAPPPNFNNIRPNVSNSNNWSARSSLLNPSINNYQQIPPTPLMSKQNTNVGGVSVPLRLPMPNLNIYPVNRFNQPKSLLGNPVMMPTLRQPNNFTPRQPNNLGNVRKEGPNWNQNNPGMQPQMQFRKRAIEDKTGPVLKHQKTMFNNKQGNLVRRKSMVVNANIKEVKIVENISAVENMKGKPIAVKVEEDEDEETKKYRAQIELQNKKRAEILRIKEERREMMANQRRKLMLKQQLLINSETTPEVNSTGGLGVTPADSLLVPVPPSPTAIKKRVLIRRVQTTPGPPRKPVTAPAKVGLAPVQVGGGPIQVGAALVKVGMAPAKVGMVNAKVGMVPANVGMVPAKIGGGPPVKVGVNPTKIGGPPNRVGVSPVYVGGVLVTPQTNALPFKQLPGTVPPVKRTLLRSPGNINNLNVNKTATLLETNQGEVKRQVQAVRQLRTVQLVNKNAEPAGGEKVKLQINNAGVIDPAAAKKVNRIVIQTSGSGEVVGNAAQIANQRLRTGVPAVLTSVLIENLSLATTEASLKQLCQFYGDVQKVEMRSDNRTAVVKFKDAVSAQTFVDRCQRRMVDLSLIAVSLVSP